MLPKFNVYVIINPLSTFGYIITNVYFMVANDLVTFASL